METLIIFSTLLFSAYSTSTQGDGLVLEEFAGKRANEVVLKYTENMENRKLETIDHQTNDQDDGRPRYPVKRRSRNQDGVFRRKILPLQLSKLMNVSETLSISAPKTEQYLDLDNSKNPNSSRRIKKVQIKSKKIQTSRLPTQKELKRFKAKYFSPPTHYKDFFLKKIFESPKESKKIPEIFENGGSTADKVPELSKTIMAATTKQLDLPVNDEITLTRDDIGSDSLLDSLNRSMLLKNGGRDRSSRFLSLFTVIRFKNEICLTSEATNGTCYTQTDCEEKGGEPQGPCASGFGVCCYFEYMCSSSTSENGTYFVNPATPHPMCNLMINRMNDDICQIKLQLDVFEIAGPDDKGECSDEFFLVTGGSPVPPICGLNSGQHLIYSITPDSGPSQLSVILSVSSTMSSNARLWNIRIYQYECTSDVLAPVGCLQYFIDASGVVQSFNYQEDIGSGNIAGTNHLSNLDYSACIRMSSGYCGIRWSQYPSDSVSFTLSGDSSILTTTSPQKVQDVKYGDTACVYDYVRIPGGSEDGSTHTSRERFCGLALGFCRVQTGKTVDCAAALGSVISYSKPFLLGVVTDGEEGGPTTANNSPQDKGNRGFKLVYNQQPCMTG